ncbi:MAG: amidase [Deltaproteobacteria bacterium]|nr:MAG: amidase [Deltaproteobacteria bacterium]
MELHEYSKFDGLGLAKLLQQKEVKASELADLALTAIKQLNPEINTVVGHIIEDSNQVDENDLPDGPFKGVPFLVKDLVVHSAGIPTDWGSRLTQNVVFDYDTELMARFKKAGLVIIGRTNTPEFGLNVTTEPVLHGPSQNPWDTSKITGGSSGGSAAAVAARIVPWAHANDGGGSIRIPASCCGLVGLKPTRGRVSLGPDFGEAVLGLAIEHVVTRTVRDSAAMLDAIQGPGIGDPYIIAPPARPYFDELSTEPGSLKIAFTSTGWNGVKVDPECVKAVADTAKLLESLGHTLIEAKPSFDFEALLNACVPAWAGWVASAVEAAKLLLGRTPSPDNLEATSWVCYQHGLNKVSGLDILNALAVFNQVNRTVGAFMQEYDVLMTPTLNAPPVDLGFYDANDESLDAKGWIDKLFLGFAHFTGLFNITGQPAVSLPLHQTDSGLPIGVQFAARFGDEATLIRLAGQLEQSIPWIERKPQISI